MTLWSFMDVFVTEIMDPRLNIFCTGVFGSCIVDLFWQVCTEQELLEKVLSNISRFGWITKGAWFA
jgi:hypothetical protein